MDPADVTSCLEEVKEMRSTMDYMSFCLSSAMDFKDKLTTSFEQAIYSKPWLLEGPGKGDWLNGIDSIIWLIWIPPVALSLLAPGPGSQLPGQSSCQVPSDLTLNLLASNWLTSILTPLSASILPTSL